MEDSKDPWHSTRIALDIVHVYSSAINTSTLNSKSSIPSLKTLKTSSGACVNRIGKGQYRIVDSGVILTAADPDAP